MFNYLMSLHLCGHKSNGTWRIDLQSAFQAPVCCQKLRLGQLTRNCWCLQNLEHTKYVKFTHCFHLGISSNTKRATLFTSKWLHYTSTFLTETTTYMNPWRASGQREWGSKLGLCWWDFQSPIWLHSGSICPYLWLLQQGRCGRPFFLGYFPSDLEATFFFRSHERIFVSIFFSSSVMGFSGNRKSVSFSLIFCR